MIDILPIASSQSSAGLFKEVLRTIRSSDLTDHEQDAAWNALYQATNHNDPRIQRHRLQQLLHRIKNMQDKSS